MAEIFGTPENDIITLLEQSAGVSGPPTEGSDSIVALAGSDSVEGLGGNDTLSGGGGNDTLLGGDGDDLLIAGGGTPDPGPPFDVAGIEGSYIHDVFDGGDGIDTLDLSSTNIAYSVLLEQNLINWGHWRYNSPEGEKSTVQNIENIIGSNGSDKIIGDAENNILSGGSGGDEIFGKDGNDQISGGSSGDDLAGGFGNDTIDGGSSTDLVDYFYTFDGRIVDLDAGTAIDNPADDPNDDDLAIDNHEQEDSDVLISIEQVKGSQGDDIILGSSFGSNTLSGSEGDDIINGRGSNNQLYGDGGADQFQFDTSANGTTTINDWGLAGIDFIHLGAIGGTASTINLADDGAGNTIITVDGVDAVTIVVENVSSKSFDLSEIDSGVLLADGAEWSSLGTESVPSYQWWYGCGTTGMGAMVGFWDVHGYDNLYEASGWDEVSLTKNVQYEIINQEHLDRHQWSAETPVRNFAVPSSDPPISIGGFAGQGVGDSRDYQLTGSAEDGLEGYTAYKGYDFDVERRPTTISNLDELWELTKYEIEAGRPVLAYVASGSGDPDHYVPVLGVSEIEDNRSYQHFNHSSTHSAMWGEYEDPLWHSFGTEDQVPQWGIDVLYFMRPESLTINDTNGSNIVAGNGGEDTVNGNGGNDTVSGGIGHDVVDGGSGDDLVQGNVGNDTLSGGTGTDTLDGGDGKDTADYSYSSNNVLIDLNAGVAVFTSGVTEDLISIENATGGSGANVLIGDGNDNVLDGGSGNDSIVGGDGDDELIGGSGSDTLIGGDGDDTLSGGSGTDLFDGGEGQDTADFSYTSSDNLQINLTTGQAVFTSSGSTENLVSIEHATGGSGDNVLIGNGDANVLDGGGGNDDISGLGGDDELLGGSGSDDISGGDGNDTLDGGSGNDELNGGAGDDVLEGGSGSDDLFGGTGNDTLGGGTGTDSFNGGDGIDTVDFSYTSSDGLEINLGTGEAVFTSGTTEDLINIENVIAGGGDDITIGDDNNNVLDGGAGNNTISGGGGDDTLIGNAGDPDTLTGSAGFNVLNGDEGDDLFLSGTADTQFNGGDGNDTFIANSGRDNFDGGDGTDLVDFTYSSSSSLTLDLQADIAYFGTFDPLSLDNEDLFNIEDAVGSSGNTRMIGDDGANLLDGFSGNDTLIGNGGGDTLIGGTGNDTLDGGAGNDTLDGGSGNDTLTGGDDADTFVIASGSQQTTVTDFDDTEFDVIDARGKGFDTFEEFMALAQSQGLLDEVDDGDTLDDIVVSADGSDLIFDFGDGDVVRFINRSGFDAEDFVLDAAAASADAEVLDLAATSLLSEQSNLSLDAAAVFHTDGLLADEEPVEETAKPSAEMVGDEPTEIAAVSEEPVEQGAAEEPVEETAVRLVVEEIAAEEPVEENADPSTEVVGDEPTEKAAVSGEPVEETVAEEPVEKAADVDEPVTQASSDEPTEAVVDEPVKRISDEPAKATVDEPVKQAEEEKAKAIVDEPVKQAEDELAEAVVDEPVKRVSDDPIKAVVEKPVKQAEDEPVRAVVEKPVKQAEDEPVRAVVEKPVKQAEDEPVKADVEKPVNHAEDEPVKAVVEKPVKQAEDEPAKAVADEPVKQAEDEPAKAVADEPVKKAEDEPAKAVADEPVKQVEDEPAKAVADEPVKQAADEPAKAVADEPVKQAEDEPAKAVADEPVKQAEDKPAKAVADEPVKQAEDEPAKAVADEPVKQVEDEPTQKAAEKPAEVNHQEPVEHLGGPNDALFSEVADVGDPVGDLGSIGDDMFLL